MYIVTGGAGFIGSCFVEKLNSEGIEDILIVDHLGESSKWKNICGKKFRDFLHKDDFLDFVVEDGLDEEIDAIIHMGACSSTTETNGDYMLENNYRYSRVLAQWAIANGTRFIYASSAATYGDGLQGYADDPAQFGNLIPLNMYGYSKHFFDLWAKRAGILDQIVGLKFFNVYGPNEYHKGSQASVVFKAFNQIKDSGTVKLFSSNDPKYNDGEQLRDFVYVKDCCELIWWFLDHPEKNGIFNVGTGKARTFKDLVSCVFSALNKKPSIEYIDMPENIANQYQNFTEAKMQKIKKLIPKMKFTSLEDGISDYVKNYLAKNTAIL
ncbi:MAG: ADP-glyceromanno-heptose 6-epimerase [Bdellovibrionales bacterium]|nr:ADP-glyceromanno-heptose 6-epimerase [Bdellovibrionales bacterium]